MPDQVSYTFDLATGALVYVWKGGFLDCHAHVEQPRRRQFPPDGQRSPLGHGPGAGRAG
jgi:hypothetical protein